MTVYAVALAVLLLAATQPTPARRVVACSYAVVTFGHLMLVSPWADDLGGAYFLTAAAGDVLVMALIMRSVKMPDTGISLMRVCVAEVVANWLGWRLWENGYDPAIYNTIFYGLSIWVMLILIRRDRAYERRGYSINSRVDNLRLIFSPGGSHLSSRSR